LVKPGGRKRDYTSFSTVFGEKDACPLFSLGNQEPGNGGMAKRSGIEPIPDPVTKNPVNMAFVHVEKIGDAFGHNLWRKDLRKNASWNL
jgi:hypothetical protein